MVLRSTSVRRGVVAMLMAVVSAATVSSASAALIDRFSGTFAPTIYGGFADLNGDGVADEADDSNAFYGDTAIIDGALDCDAWAVENDGAGGDLVIDVNDDCTLIGVDGTADGVEIGVVDGSFATADGDPIADGTELPHVFNAADPTNASVAAADFAWSVIQGRVDANGDETIDSDDCSVGIIADANILANGANVCGFATAPPEGSDGKVDLDGDVQITVADTCLNGCFFGMDVVKGLVVETECSVLGTSGDDVLVGSDQRDVICARGGDDRIRALAARDRVYGGGGDDIMRGGDGPDRLFGGPGPDVARGGRARDTCRSAVIQRSCER